MDTRYIQFSSDDAVIGRGTSNFVLNLSTAVAEIHDRIIGVSIESLALPNVQPNVSPLIGIGNTIAVLGEVIDIPESYYNATELAAALEVAMLAHPVLGLLPMTVVWEPLPIARFTIAGGPGGVTTITDPWETSPSLFTNMGFEKDTVNNGVTQNLPDLTGMKVMRLSSDLITSHGNQSVDGNGHLSNVIHTLPIDVEYGRIQTYKGESMKPTIYFGKLSRNSEMSAIDIEACTGSGTPVQLGGGKLMVVLKVWVGSL